MYGPQMPPGFKKPSSLSSKSQSDSESDNDAFGPVLPPEFKSSRAQPQTSPALPSKRVMGPTMPPPGATLSVYKRDDSDDDVGPRPLDLSDKDLEEHERTERLKEIEARLGHGSATTSNQDDPADMPTCKSSSVKREDWMTLPPEAMRLKGGPQMTSRQFSSTVKEKTVDQTLWIESPKDREKRIISGKDKKRKQDDQDDKPHIMSREEKETADFITQHNAMHRPKTLMQDFTIDYVKSGKFEEDDASKRSFDRDKDIASRRIDAKGRKRLLDDAQKLDSKFASGKKTYL
ncbi:hypothetical protein BDV3_005308 [Batrachochytrium dendrobatidis]|uniref:DUF3752 domain-containing protein n=1 Tax=Batrachochytrium dendrobatidis (strain JEL423) TaxID=403673 RepID=A0A177WHB0_BATDL|nr:hypothetical protein BDEG_23336 [Batrachochytrium dendrobatidis JEL423]